MDNGEPVIHRAALCPQAPQPSISFDKKTSKSKPIIGRLIYKKITAAIFAATTIQITAKSSFAAARRILAENYEAAAMAYRPLS